MIDFLILYEVAVRELEGVTLLGNELINRGYSVEYLSFTKVAINKYANYHRFLKKFFNKVRVVLMPSLYHDTELLYIVYYVCGKVDKIVNLRWEQFATNKEMRDLNAAFFPCESAKNVYHICWGKYSFDTLVQRGINPKLLPITGALHLDFVRPEFSSFYLERNELFEKYDIDPSYKVVLYVSSFGLITLPSKQLETIEESFDGRFKFDKDELMIMKESYDKTIDWIDGFLNQASDCVFVYRPHPTEVVTNKVKRLMKEHSNFRVIRDYSVKQWVLTCDKVLTWISTSLSEIYFAKKPCYIIRPLQVREEDDLLVYKEAKFICTKQSFLDILNDKGADASCPSSNIMEYCYSFDCVPSYIRLANEVENILLNNVSFDWNFINTALFEKKRPSFLFKSIVFNVFFPVAFCISVLKKKLKLSFGSKLNKKFDNYYMLHEKEKADKKHDRSLVKISKKTAMIVEKLKDCKWEK